MINASDCLVACNKIQVCNSPTEFNTNESEGSTLISIGSSSVHESDGSTLTPFGSSAVPGKIFLKSRLITIN